MEKRIAIITVENERKRSAVTPEMMRQFAEHLTVFGDDACGWPRCAT